MQCRPPPQAQVAKAQRTREREYTTPEAIAVLKATTNYNPKNNRQPGEPGKRADHGGEEMAADPVRLLGADHGRIE